MEATIRYFDSKGKENTDQVIDLAIERAIDRKITHIVVASSSGKTGLRVAERAGPKGIKTVIITYHHGFSKKGKWNMKEKYIEKLRDMRVPIISATHTLSGVERSITRKFAGPSRVELIAEVMRSLFGQGLKVCVEISVMAADGGAVPCEDDTEIISIGGSSEGADTAVILTPAHSNSFFDLAIREIIAMPRNR